MPDPERESGADTRPNVAFFDCYSGISGDMILGALIDAGLPEDELRADLACLPVGGYELQVDRVVRSGLAGTQVRVKLDRPDPVERHLSDIESLIDESTLQPEVGGRARAVFRRLAEVEARVHGIEVDAVHFHEVGAVDAIVDVVGAVAGLARLGVRQAYASDLPLARGTTKSAHGPLPLPAPATLALLADASAPTRPAGVEKELVTPTGAAILTTVAEFRQPSMRIQRVGTGVGSWELPWPNVLRMWLGEATDTELERGEVTVIETNLDDCQPEQVSFAVERLFEAGALDVSLSPVYMKKGRPGVLLTVLALPPLADLMARTILRETTSLGVRFRRSERLMAPRRIEMIETPYGPMQVKIKSIEGAQVICPEYEECARVARERNLPIGQVYAAVAAVGFGTRV